MVTKKASKNLGQHFTPEHVANFMVDLSSVSKNGKILEPCCGEGVFLKLLEEKGYKKIKGYEVDKTLRRTAKTQIVFESFVSADIKDKYDLIIGNPPYIRWKNLDEVLKKELKTSTLWQENFNSLCDYLYIFVLKSIELLEDGGELIFITPEYWINTKHAEVLRDYMVKKGVFSEVVHFGETPIFDKVASSVLVFKYIKRNDSEGRKQKIKVTKCHSSQRLTEQVLLKIKNCISDEKIEVFEIDQFEVGKRWMLAPSSVSDELKKYEDRCTSVVANSLFGEVREYATLGDIADIANGMVSGLDKAFQIPKEVSLSQKEKEATLSVVKAKNMERFIHKDITSYIFLNGDVKTENDLKGKYPTFYELLKCHKEKLELRYSYNRKINYWEWVFLRSFNLFKQERERIFVPCKERISHKQHFRFSYVPSGIFPTQDVTAIFPKPNVKESIYYILALLSSEYVFEWLKHKGVVKGNIVEFSEKPLASIPIRRIDWNNSEERKLHDEISFLCKSYVQTRNERTLENLNQKVSALF